MVADTPGAGAPSQDRLILQALHWTGDGDGASARVYRTLLSVFGKSYEPEKSFQLPGWQLDDGSPFRVSGAWIPGDARPPRWSPAPGDGGPLALDAPKGFGPVVGILDSRICPHPVLAGCYTAPAAVYRDPAELDVQQPPGLDPAAPHATFVAGIIARQAPAARILVKPVVGPDRARLADILSGLVELKEAGAQVINLSLGSYTEDDQTPESLEVLLRVLGPDIVLVAAAGNRNAQEDQHRPTGRPWWPAALDGVVAVGSARMTEAGWEPSAFSNRGPWVNVWAPGEDLVSTFVGFPGDDGAGAVESRDPRQWRWAQWDGTSFAAAVVTGRIAAEVAAAAGRGEQLTAWQALNGLVAQSEQSIDVQEGETGGTAVIDALWKDETARP